MSVHWGRVGSSLLKSMWLRPAWLASQTNAGPAVKTRRKERDCGR